MAVVRPALVVLLAFSAAQAQQYRGYWADAFHPGYRNPAELDRLIEDVVTSRCNAVFLEARLYGRSYYLKSLEPPIDDPQYQQGFDALEYLIERAHARGIEVHAWLPVTPLWPYTQPPADPRHVWHTHGPRAAGDQMWMTVSQAGRLATSLDLGHPDALRYLADVIVEPARHYDLDGLHLDYIRYPEDVFDQGVRHYFGWNPVAVERFRRLENGTGIPSPTDPRWSAFRRRQVTELVRQVYVRAIAIKPSIKVSAALITWGDGPVSDDHYRTKDAYTRVFQDWRGWLEEGILDLGIPMNYFRETTNAAFFDRWIEYEKDRQYNRGVVIGPAIYLNSIPNSLGQLRRVLAPSASGNRALGVNFYSYATTNIELPGGGTEAPNAEFYRAVGEFFGEAATAPSLPWKTSPTKGHVYGTLYVEGGPSWLKDGAAVWVESDTGSFRRETRTDGTGFFGAVDLEPDRYRVRIERGGREFFRTTPQQVSAGRTVAFEIFLKAEDFVVPEVRSVEGKTAAAQGDKIVLRGAGFAAEEIWATAVPLPGELGRTQVVVNGQAAPLFWVSPERTEIQLPYAAADAWEIVVKHDGLESAPYRLAVAEASPAIVGVRRAGGSFWEVYATGLGPVDPPIAAGLGAGPEEPLPRVVLPVAVRLRTETGESDVSWFYAGLAPYQPGLYQVNMGLPGGVERGDIRLQVGGAVSAPAPLTPR